MPGIVHYCKHCGYIVILVTDLKQGHTNPGKWIHRSSWAEKACKTPEPRSDR